MMDSRELRQLKKILKEVNALADAMKALSDEELQAKTPKLQAELASGKTLDDLLPEAFAAMREASMRVLHMFPYDTQVLGGIALHRGKIAEMKTGEGKTLVATMPLYLNALSGEPCYLVTTNDYLAARDGEQMKPLFAFMGLTENVGLSKDPFHPFTNEQKKEAYSGNIVYTSNATLVFDYLFDNLADSREHQFMRKLHYVIIDEADSVLLDSAQTPLNISGAPRVQSNLFEAADYFVSMLEEGADYEKENRQVWLTERGMDRAEEYFDVKDLYDDRHHDLVRHINLALRAHAVYTKEEEYIVRDGEICLLDQKSARVVPRTHLRAGQHQALEAKEHVALTPESRSMASISYQDFFRMFDRKAGMTGTGLNNREEFHQVYGLDVVAIPPHKKVIRKDYPDQYFTTHQAQIGAAMQEAFRVHATGQPVLIITDSIAMSNVVSEILMREGIPHSVLNAYNEAKEAEIIKEAGQKGALTVATPMAGRGTDIHLGDGVKDLGGLAVIGIGRMENIREELQARGRSGRQGDPGFSKFYVSLEDDVVVRHGSAGLAKYRNGDYKNYGNFADYSWIRDESRSYQSGRNPGSTENGQHSDAGGADEQNGGNDWSRQSGADRRQAAEDKADSVNGGNDWNSGSRDHNAGSVRGTRIHSRRLIAEVQKAQEISEEQGESRRRQTMEFGESMRLQRDYVYRMRNQILRKNRTDIDYYMEIAGRVIDRFLQEEYFAEEERNPDKDSVRRPDSGKAEKITAVNRLNRFILEHITYEIGDLPADLNLRNRKLVRDYLLRLSRTAIEEKNSQFATGQEMDNFYRLTVLKAVDTCWIEEVDYLNQLRVTVFGRQSAQRNVVFEYHEEALRSFRVMQKRMEESMMRNILLGEIVHMKNGSTRVFFP